MRNVESYPGEIVEINGTDTGPWPPGPASGFTYTLDVSTNDGVQRFTGVKPNQERWSDTYNVNPIGIGTLVMCFIVGEYLTFAGRELPDVVACTPPQTPGSGRNLPDIVRFLSQLLPAEREVMKRFL